MPVPFHGGLQLGLPAARRAAAPLDAASVPTWCTSCRRVRSAARPAAWRGRLGIPLTSSFHTNFPSYGRHYGFGWLEPLAMRYLRSFHAAAGVTIVPTRQVHDQLAAAGFQHLAIVGRGVDTTTFHPGRRSDALRRSWGAGPADLVALVVGRLAPEKNVPLAVRAYRAMAEVRPGTRLVLVGDGPERARLQAALPEAVFTGMLRGDALAAHYASADVFLFPSLTETFGNVTLEAMASGLAVVAYDDAAAAQHIRPVRERPAGAARRRGRAGRARAPARPAAGPRPPAGPGRPRGGRGRELGRGGRRVQRASGGGGVAAEDGRGASSPSRAPGSGAAAPAAASTRSSRPRVRLCALLKTTPARSRRSSSERTASSGRQRTRKPSRATRIISSVSSLTGRSSRKPATASKTSRRTPMFEPGRRGHAQPVQQPLGRHERAAVARVRRGRPLRTVERVGVEHGRQRVPVAGLEAHVDVREEEHASPRGPGADLPRGGDAAGRADDARARRAQLLGQPVGPVAARVDHHQLDRGRQAGEERRQVLALVLRRHDHADVVERVHDSTVAPCPYQRAADAAGPSGGGAAGRRNVAPSQWRPKRSANRRSRT